MSNNDNKMMTIDTQHTLMTCKTQDDMTKHKDKDYQQPPLSSSSDSDDVDDVESRSSSLSGGGVWKIGTP